MVSPQRIPRFSAPVAMTVAGSDSGANAGAQVDLLTFAANGVYGTSALTCLTAQNPKGITNIHPVPVDFIVDQAAHIVEFFQVKAAKTGMLFSRETIERVAAFFAERPAIKLVVDPVLVASSGKRLLQADAIETLMDELLPLATVITPNLDEAEILLGRKLATQQDMEQGALELARRYGVTALVKGGHLPGNELFDIVCQPDGAPIAYQQTRIQDIDTHGSGCTLSAATAAGLAKGLEPLEALQSARAYLRRGMEQGVRLSGERFINHFPS